MLQTLMSANVCNLLMHIILVIVLVVLLLRGQPIDLNLDEATMMKIVPFLRKSPSSSTRSQQYYFDHFEIHPIKVWLGFPSCFL